MRRHGRVRCHARFVELRICGKRRVHGAYKQHFVWAAHDPARRHEGSGLEDHAHWSGEKWCERRVVRRCIRLCFWQRLCACLKQLSTRWANVEAKYAALRHRVACSCRSPSRCRPQSANADDTALQLAWGPLPSRLWPDPHGRCFQRL